MKRESIAASLAKSERRDGKIRQRLIGQIGFGIRSCCLAEPLVRARFWKFALDDLDRFKVIGLPRVRAIVRLATVVKPPSEVEWATYERTRPQNVSVPTQNGTENTAREGKVADARTPEVATLHANPDTLPPDMTHEVSPKTGVP